MTEREGERHTAYGIRRLLKLTNLKPKTSQTGKSREEAQEAWPAGTIATLKNGNTERSSLPPVCTMRLVLLGGAVRLKFPSMAIARILALLLACSALSACGGGGQARFSPSTTVMEVVSIPARCVVEMNGEYLGGTPVKIDIPSTPDGRWTGANSTKHRITVSTPNNRAVETKEWRGGDVIPRRVLFRPPYAYLTGTGR